jgi:hypothetical protein
MNIREKHYELWVQLMEIHFNAQIEWGKWIVASLLFIHGGALVAIVQSEGHAIEMMNAGGIWFVWGLVAALGTGVITWANWTYLTSVYQDWANPNAIVDDASWPALSKWGWFVRVTFWAAILIGIASVGFLIYGALQIQAALPSS